MNGKERRLIRQQIRSLKREVLPQLKGKLKSAKRIRAERIKACRAECRKARRKAIADAKRARAKLRTHIERARARARSLCDSCRADLSGLSEIERMLAELNKEREQISELRSRAAAIPVSERRRKGGLKAAEKRAESDDEVRRNLGDDRDMVALWESVKGKIKFSPRRSRTEAFFEWLEEHPEALDELRSKQERQWEDEAERLFAERAACRSCQSDKPEVLERSLGEWQHAQKWLEDVPF